MENQAVPYQRAPNELAWLDAPYDDSDPNQSQIFVTLADEVNNAFRLADSRENNDFRYARAVNFAATTAVNVVLATAVFGAISTRNIEAAKYVAGAGVGVTAIGLTGYLIDCALRPARRTYQRVANLGIIARSYGISYENSDPK